jgi:hypothetical protein
MDRSELLAGKLQRRLQPHVCMLYNLATVSGGKARS